MPLESRLPKYGPCIVSQFKIVFEGQILPGNDPDEVRARLVAALKAAPRAAERLFSGRPVTLKAGLDEAQAQSYRRRLSAMGVAVRVEAEGAPAAAVPAPLALTSATPAPAPAPAPPQAPAAASMPASIDRQTDPGQPASTPAGLALVNDAPDRMECPKCSYSQPRRTLCLACGIDMPRYAAAQAQLQAEEHAQAMPPLPAVVRTDFQGADADPDEPIDPPRLFGLDRSGRMARLSYVSGSLLVGAAMVYVTVASVFMFGPVMTMMLVAATIFPLLRLVVLRLHDLNWSGWWALLFVVPVVGNLLGLVLTFVPGSRGENDFGPPSRTHGWRSVLISLAVLFVPTMIIAAVVPQLIPAQLRARTAGLDEANERALMAGYNPSANEVFMFSESGCQPCAARRAQFERVGLQYTEFFVDEDPELARLLGQRLADIGVRGVPRLPAVEINGTLIANDPSLEQLADYFIR